jgi:hypothetical protein
VATAGDPHWIDYVAAFGTVAAAVIALGVASWAWLREGRRRPRLRLLYDHRGIDFAADVPQNDGRDHHFVRMRVENRSGRRSAEEVQVLTVALARDGKLVMERSFGGYAFKWSLTHAGRTSSMTTLTVPPGMARRVDLLQLPEPASATGDRAKHGEEGADLRLQVEPTPPDTRHHLGAGRYTIYVVLTARDTDAAYYAVDVEHDGRWWSGDEIRGRLRLSEPRALKGPPPGT